MGSVRASTEKLGIVRVLGDEEGIVLLAEIARELSRGAEYAVGDHPRERDEGGHLAPPRRQLADHRPIGREVRSRGGGRDDIRLGLVSRQRVIGGRVVDDGPMADRADHRHGVHDSGHPRQQLAHRQARHARGDRLELAAQLGRRVRLHVERVLLGDAAELVKEDHRLGPHLQARLRLGPQGGRQAQPQCSQGPDLEHLPAREHRTIEVGTSPGSWHSWSPGSGQERIDPLSLFNLYKQSGEFDSRFYPGFARRFPV